MEQPQKIRLFASRDFSGNFDTSFAFIKQNYGAILKPLLYLIPILLIASFFMPNNMDTSDMAGYTDPLDIYWDMFTFSFFVAYLFMMMAMLLMTTYVIPYLVLHSSSV